MEQRGPAKGHRVTLRTAAPSQPELSTADERMAAAPCSEPPYDQAVGHRDIGHCDDSVTLYSSLTLRGCILTQHQHHLRQASEYRASEHGRRTSSAHLAEPALGFATGCRYRRWLMSQASRSGCCHQWRAGTRCSPRRAARKRDTGSGWLPHDPRNMPVTWRGNNALRYAGSCCVPSPTRTPNESGDASAHVGSTSTLSARRCASC